MRTPYRIATTAVAVVAAFPLGMGSAHADTAQPTVIQGAWYWAEQSVAVGPEALTPPATTTGVPAKDLAVAYKGKGDDQGAPDKVTYLAWDFSAVPPGATVSKFEFTMKLATEPQAVQAAPPEYQLIACGAVGDFIPAEAGPFSDRPADDCSAQVPGTYNATAKEWTFDVAPYAQLWANGDPASGIGIMPAKDSAKPFQVVFQPADTVRTSVEFTPAEPVVSPETPPPAVAPPPPPAQAYVPPPVIQQPQPQPQTFVSPPKPVVLAPVAPVVPVTRQGMTWPSKSALPATFWAGALAAVALFGIASLVLGDATVPVEAPRGRTVTRSLRDRQAAHRGALPRAQTHVRTV